MLTSFGLFSFFNVTCAFFPSDDISNSFTSPVSILAINSEYESSLLPLPKIDVINTMKIINIINHIAKVFILFFTFFPPLL